MAEYRGSAYTRWNEDVRSKYISIISDARLMLKQIPRWEGSGLVFDSDVDDLVLLCEMFDIDIDKVIQEIKSDRGRMKYLKKLMDNPYEEEDEQHKDEDSRTLLYDISVFKAIKGRIYKEMRTIVEEKLKPTDPLLEKISELDNIGDKEKRDIMGENEPDI